MNKFRLHILIAVTVLLLAGCDKEVSRTPVAPPPPEGFVFVQSTPPGFAIYQNGKNTGRFTPDTLRFLEPGDYQITLKKLYWKDTTLTVTVTETELAIVNVDFLSNDSMFGDLVFFSNPPGAQVILNDSLLNITTPDTLTHLFPGKYNVKYRLHNFRDESFEAIVESSKRKLYSASLRDTSVWVDFQVFNSDIPSNSLSVITIDNNGTIWIGSFDAGLIKFDRVNFTNFTKMNSPLPDNRINSLTVDAQNKLWIGTNFGLAVYDGSSWVIYNQTNSGIPTDVINSVNFDDSGIAWIGTSGGLAKFDGVNWQVFNDADFRVWAMDSDVDNSGVVWAGTKEAGIVKLENNSLIFVPDSIYNYPTERISSVEKDMFGNIWFTHLPDSARRSGASFWDGSQFNNFFLGTANNNVNHIFIDDENNKWVSTWEGFFFLDQSNNVQSFTTFNSLISSDVVNASVRDANGVLWITTAGGGLNKFKF